MMNFCLQMCRLAVHVPVLLSVCVLLSVSTSMAVSPLPVETEQLRRFVGAKFHGLPESEVIGLQVLANLDRVQLNQRNGKPLQIAGEQFNRGLYCHAHSRIVVRLPSPGKSFHAKVGVDSNDQTRPGLGSVVFNVVVGGQYVFRSGLMREGMTAETVEANLDGAKQFLLEVGDGDSAVSCDQADWADARVVLENGETVWLADLALSENKKKQIVYGDGPLFSFHYGGVSSSEFIASWNREESQRQLDDERTQHTVTWLDPETGLRVTCVGIEYHDFPAVEWIVTYKNTSDRNTPILENLSGIDTQIVCVGGTDCQVHHAKGSDATFEDFAPRTDTLRDGSQLELHSHGGPTSWPGVPSGSPSVESLPMFNVEWHEQGFITALGWTGPWFANFTRSGGNGLQVSSRMDGIHLSLRPDEEIRGQRVLMLFWNGDRVRAHNLWRRLMLKHYAPRPGGKPFEGLLTDSSWSSWMDADTHIKQINWWADHDLPMECYWMDAGWTDGSEGWVAHQSRQDPDKKLFPKGLRPISDAAHRRGMKYLLWFVPDSLWPGVGIAAEHPEWLSKPLRDPKRFGDWVFYGLDFGNPQVMDYLIKYYSKIIEDYGIDVFRQDGTGLWWEDTESDRVGISQIRYTEGLYKFWDGLVENHPDLLIDNCGTGGRKLDLETIRRSVILWRSDSQGSGDFDPISCQAFNQGLFPWIPLNGGAVPLVRLSKYTFRSAYAPALEVCWRSGGVKDLAKDRWSYVDMNLMRELLKEYLSVRPYTFGDYYPLVPYNMDQSIWTAWQFDRPDLGEGMIQAFRRPDSIYESIRVRPRGLEPDAVYEIANLDRNGSEKKSGRDLMEAGLVVEIASQPGSAVVTYKKTGE